jgi:YebC/PmpR family DNA-binding regulatory protein
MQKAREVNMPQDKIQNAIKRGTGELKGGELEEIRMEGYGANGVAVMADCLTDNRNRTVADLRHLFSRFGGNLGENGSVAWMFQRRGVVLVDPQGRDPDEVALQIIDAGSEDFTVDDGQIEVQTDPTAFEQVKNAIEAMGLKLISAELSWVPTTTVALDESQAPAVLRLLDSLEDHDDVQNVYANFDIAADVLERVSASV